MNYNRAHHFNLLKISHELKAKLILIEPNKKAENFGLLIGDLIMLFDRYNSNPDIGGKNVLNEEKLKKILKEMKERYP